MTFDELLTQAVELLKSEGRVSYRALKRRFALDDEYLEDLKAELIDAKRLATDEDGKVLVWAGKGINGETDKRGKDEDSPESSVQHIESTDQPLAPNTQPPAGERRQLTVMFIDLVGSTTLSAQLDPEDYHARVVAYQTACRQVIARYEGHIAQYLGDGVLVYFGYPAAHEEDAVRAVRSGLEIVTAVNQLAYTPPLQVRIGIHTGPVVVGEIGAGEHTERLALGETPNIAARVQGVAKPATVVISPTTYRLVTGLFECQDLGPQTLKGLSAPMEMHRVVQESEAQSRFEVTVRIGLTPIIGRAHEMGLLRERWERAKQGEGQVVLLSGEAGIGKSRFVQELKEQVSAEDATCLAFRCSPYHQNSAFYPIIEHVQRRLQFQREETPQTKLVKLQQALAQYHFPQADDTLALLAALLSLPHPEGVSPITLSPQKQKQKTQEALVAWLVEEAERTPVYCVWEDLHWTDPSTVEVLHLLLTQVPTARILTLLTFRLEFIPPWGPHSHSTPLTLSRLGHHHVSDMVEHVAGGQALPQEILQQIVAKTDGVPLFVEELTKTVLESIASIGSIESIGSAIPTTLHDALMARLDRMGAAKEIAQMGATLGREFSYEVLHTVSPLQEAELQQALEKLVEAEVLYQRGMPPQAHYFFKHALIQDVAYLSLLKSTRQKYHQQIAQILEEKFSETKEIQPELLAHHYTETGLIEQAIPYWQKAGQRAAQRSASVEAINHLTKGLELLKALPDTPEHAQRELMMQIALGGPLIAIRGYAAPAVGQTYTRARELCQQMGEVPQLFPVLRGLWVFYNVRAEYKTARELGEQCFTLAQRQQDPALLVEAHYALGNTLTLLGDFASSRAHLEQGVAVYDSQRHPFRTFLYGQDLRVGCLSYATLVLWGLGYSDQAIKKSQEALALAYELSHPFSLAFALLMAAMFFQLRREWQAAQEQAEACITLSTEQGFALTVAVGTMPLGWALAEQGQGEEGITRMHQGLAAYRATGAAEPVVFSCPDGRGVWKSGSG